MSTTATPIWKATVKSVKDEAATVTIVPDAAAPPVPDDHGNPVPVSFRFVFQGKRAKVRTAVIVGTTEPPDVNLHLQVHDEDGQPLKSLPFELKAAGKVVTGQTSDSGLVEVTFQRAPEAQLTVKGPEQDHQFKLQLGKLDAAETVLGAQQRLQSLGYELRVSGKLDDATKKAIAAFRGDSGLPAGDALDADASKKLDDEYRREMRGD